MLWFSFLPPEFDALLRPAPRPPGGDRDPAPDPSAVDLWLVDLAYGVVTAATRCARCGANLGAPRRRTPSAAGTRGWSVAVVVRCRGRRRHRHTATATRAAGDLALGPLRPA